MESNTSSTQITLFSEMDVDGTILFVNDAFCEVSQYSRDELIGKPHNIIRHPDMPKSLFQNLWGTIKKEGVFRGIIKNKAKDDSPYWVRATIMPFLDSKMQKFISVRHLIEDTRLAQQLYDQQVRLLKL